MRRLLRLTAAAAVEKPTPEGFICLSPRSEVQLERLLLHMPGSRAYLYPGSPLCGISLGLELVMRVSDVTAPHVEEEMQRLKKNPRVINHGAIDNVYGSGSRRSRPARGGN